MALQTLQCTFYDFNVAYYVLVSLLIVNNLWYYVFNGHIFRSTVNREDSCTVDLFSTFHRCPLVWITGGGGIGNFNNQIASNLLLCTCHFKNVYKILVLVFCFLFVVIVYVLFRSLNALLKFFPKHQVRKLRQDVHHKLSCLYVAILSNYLA